MYPKKEKGRLFPRKETGICFHKKKRENPHKYQDISYIRLSSVEGYRMDEGSKSYIF
jgi:hypothetical protein